MELRAANIIDPEIEGHYAFFPFVEQISTREHQHDFFEIFLISQGQINHHINGQTLLLDRGALVLIRPEDAHYFSKQGDSNCELLNLAFLQDTFSAAGMYLGVDLMSSEPLIQALPACINTSIAENQWLTRRLKNWGSLLYRDKSLSRQALRGLLAMLISDYFLTRLPSATGDAPPWLMEVCHKMKQRENVVEGRAALMRLANRSPEYVGRTFKSALGITPSQYINDLRLDLASDLLIHSDIPTTAIAYEVGFGNLSHFYHLFKDRWECSPNQYRKLHQQTLLP